MTIIELRVFGERRRMIGTARQVILVGETWQILLNGRWDDDRTVWYDDL